MNKIDDEDIKILAVIRNDGRAKLTKISRLTGIPTTTLHERLKHLRKTLIKKFSVVFDFDKIGYLLSANVLIKIKTDKEIVKEYLLKHKNVNTLYEINNGWDFMMEVIFKNIKQLEQFLQEIDQKYEIKNKQIHYILDIIKKEEFLTNLIRN